ncbi:YdeI/OmpD-associated family protein [Mucilaginibacter sp. HMF5004]|uniref:YdeI/OmpD-associated family protein n=1 Tax=Mucilaginibacter rivuli TaxID=2857527 RepID=UPI001C5FE1FF|nr:YdeI/OmpD-associated family protein [Mucilaginibacter rivuli]MBW4891735.1 YdeI/OmpD-associated family protein [Mucilaginibacter rivuli]
MPGVKKYSFKATIYKTGINFAVDVPGEITTELKAVKGYIRIMGTVNGFEFTKSLVPVKNGPYRLFVNMITLKGAKANVGDTAAFIIAQDTTDPEREHPVPQALIVQLQQKGLLVKFDALTPSRRKEIVRYLNSVKTDETFQKNMDKLIARLEDDTVTVRVP